MIRRRSKREVGANEVEPMWFDDFDLRLGDMMRGERATLGKSLLDVQRELRIKASYIAAIENADPDAFDTPGFIAGYVRSYARYLGMDPDKAFAAFCAESGFTTAHGMSAEASTIRKGGEFEIKGRKSSGLGGSKLGRGGSDPLLSSGIGFTPARDSVLSRVEPRAIGSMLVLVALIGGLGFGGWTVLNEIQRVQVTPVESTPDVLAELDPLDAVAQVDDVVRDAAQNAATGTREVAAAGAGVFSPPAASGDRLLRPQALDVPVMVSRDAPILTLDPASVGTFAASEGMNEGAVPRAVNNALTAAMAGEQSELVAGVTPQVMEEAPKGVTLFAVRPAWVRVRSVDGSIIFEKILEAGEEYKLPAEVEAPTLQAGMSGSLYFEIDGELFGPAGNGTATVRKLSMARSDLLASYEPADLSQDPELAKVIAMAEAQSDTPLQD
ncbi:helix-turn-helix domain-containing protein [Rhodalgimonas zhirmunskyi]|uniref:DUF4115 domain-containing protein n=1 Tax=Rhodalgimonas zhirmunskyi TaxID=2964767 RepID=A0AAJ1U2P5_9RHOB|nr:RodZ domain-containing protein [Rhodoalgimonas zhirmunskyi]MDQ2092545.1 DUF4115 domain-containing protein [Rhodoalgimonas zhirmunskyi]